MTLTDTPRSLNCVIKVRLPLWLEAFAMPAEWYRMRNKFCIVWLVKLPVFCELIKLLSTHSAGFQTAVELRLGEKSAGQLENLIGSAQFLVLSLQGFDALALFS
jgi:hypothetical protein